MTPLEIAAVAFTLVNVWLAVKENIWCWPPGIVGVALYGIVFYRSNLYANAALQVVYLVLSIHGWYEWLHGGAGRTELRMSSATPRQWRVCMVAGVAGTGLVILLLRWTTDAAFPFWDALTTSFSLVAQWMMNKKLVENWILWIAVDVIYVPLCFFRSLPLTAALYALFCVMAWRGLVEWRRSLASA